MAATTEIVMEMPAEAVVVAPAVKPASAAVASSPLEALVERIDSLEAENTELRNRKT